VAAPAIAEMFRTRPQCAPCYHGLSCRCRTCCSPTRAGSRSFLRCGMSIILGGAFGGDINLSVLKPGVISDCKSEIKWLEAAMLGIPSIVSATQTHTEL